MKSFTILSFFIFFNISSYANELKIKFDVNKESVYLLLINESDSILKVHSGVVFNYCAKKNGYCIEYKYHPDPTSNELYLKGGSASKIFHLWPDKIIGKKLERDFMKKHVPEEWQQSELDFRIKYFLPNGHIVTSDWYNYSFVTKEIKGLSSILD